MCSEIYGMMFKRKLEETVNRRISGLEEGKML